MKGRTLRVALGALLLVFGRAAASVAQTLPPDSIRGVVAVAGVAPDTVTVGDHFVVRIGVTAMGATRVDFPQFTRVEPVEALDSLRVQRDSTGTWIATYRLAAWIPSDSLIGRFPFRISRADGTGEDRFVRVRLPVVASVLPADSALHQPRPARAVLPITTPATTGRGWLLPAIVLAVLVALVALLALRGRNRRPVVFGDPREAALAALSAIESEHLPESGHIDLYYVRTSRVLRRYLAAAMGLSEDLTSAELLRHARQEALSQRGFDDLETLLRAADRVKFSGEPTAEELSEITGMPVDRVLAATHAARVTTVASVTLTGRRSAMMRMVTAAVTSQ